MEHVDEDHGAESKSCRGLRHTRMLMDDAMEHVDEDHGAESKSAPTYDQARSATTDDADTDDDTDTDADAATYDQARSAATDADADADAAPVRASAPKSTMKLNKATAIAIFQAGRCQRGWRSSLSAELGRRYGLTAKTVRDIWNGRTWAKVTKPFWTAQDEKLYEARKKYKASKKQACSGHPTPYPTPDTLATDLPCADSLWWPRVDGAWTAEDKKQSEEKTKYEVRKMQACSGHPTPYPTPNALAMRLPCADSHWWPRVDGAGKSTQGDGREWLRGRSALPLYQPLFSQAPALLPNTETSPSSSLERGQPNIQVALDLGGLLARLRSFGPEVTKRSSAAARGL
jgi:hypothetical protein